jgi:hypothetical protein
METYTFSEVMDPSKFATTMTIESSKPDYNITFHDKDSQVIGRLDFNGPALAFEGDAKESATVFISWIAEIFSKRLKEEYQRGYEDCLTEEAKK